MLALKNFRDKAAGVNDLLNWAALLRGRYRAVQGWLLPRRLGIFRGRISRAAPMRERDWLAGRINAALSRLGSGWATWTEAIRTPAVSYPPPELSHFPDPVSRLVDEERRRQFIREGVHFESRYVLVVQYTPPMRRKSKVADLIYDDDPTERQSPSRPRPQAFQKAISDFEDAIGDAVKLERMRTYVVTDRQGREHLRDELVNYLHFALTGEANRAEPPVREALISTPCWAAASYGPATRRRLGDKFIACVAIEGFPVEVLAANPRCAGSPGHPLSMVVADDLPRSARDAGRTAEVPAQMEAAGARVHLANLPHARRQHQRRCAADDAGGRGRDCQDQLRLCSAPATTRPSSS